MDGDILDAFEGPRTLMIFAYLLFIVVVMLFLGEVLSVAYGVSFLRNIMMGFAEHPGQLLGIAGVLSLAWLGIRAAAFASQIGGR